MKKTLIKKTVLLTAVVLVGFSLALPQASYANGYYGGYGWWVPGAFLGGMLLGAAIARPWYPPPVYAYPPPAPVYAYPQPAYVYPPRQTYAYPDPNHSPRPRAESPPGEWVTVPGQWVGGKWVPQHKAWAPSNP
jgi:hypothetical protein